MTEGQTLPKPRLVKQVKTMEKVEAPTIQTYYTNSVDVLSSVYDFTLTLGQMRAAGPETVIVEQQARVIMSPQHMKALAQLLIQKVVDYEENVGPIPEAPAEPQLPSERAPAPARGPNPRPARSPRPRP